MIIRFLTFAAYAFSFFTLVGAGGLPTSNSGGTSSSSGSSSNSYSGGASNSLSNSFLAMGKIIGIFFLNLIYFLTISAEKLFLSSLEIGKTITFALFIAFTAANVKSEGSPGPTPTIVKDAKSVLKKGNKLKNFFIFIIYAQDYSAMNSWHQKSLR